MPARRPRARLNRIEARSLPLRHFTLNGTDHAEDRRLRAVVDWVNVVSVQYPGRQDRLGGLLCQVQRVELNWGRGFSCLRP
ncbi:hypothetical protein [Streptomyces sp. NRRL S-15]|uniref:hypothetical protein n=1 Tax=Streptomyces sp. NRRL S-15 TaxID=1463886 RepID=UPI000A9B7864|nr:hypothetical protein [Streptomyces sp. NRRL S-15]